MIEQIFIKQMRLFKPLLLLLAVIALLTGCAKRPVENLNETRSVVAHAYTAGAVQHAPGEYQLASSALQAAELQIRSGEYRSASRTLGLAQRYAKKALQLTVMRKGKLLEEKNQLARKKQLLEKQRQIELERQTELLQRQQQKKIKPEPKKLAPVVKKISPAAVEPELIDQVEVVAGENLAMIAARVEVYTDALLWPLIYRANRDQIKDPLEIFSGQILLIPRDKTRDEIEAARLEARDLNLF